MDDSAEVERIRRNRGEEVETGFSLGVLVEICIRAVITIK